MKLRNKKTGEICEFMIHKRIKDSKDGNPVYAPFNDSVEDWEDYEEHLIYYSINEFSQIESYPVGCISDEDRKQIGNYFTTEEQAKKAVEKLKAWTRLKDKGFKFESWFGGSKDISFWLDTEIDEDIAKDLDLLFGGEE